LKRLETKAKITTTNNTTSSTTTTNKLDKVVAAKIRAEYQADDTLTMQALADKYDVSKETISKVLQNNTYYDRFYVPPNPARLVQNKGAAKGRPKSNSRLSAEQKEGIKAALLVQAETLQQQQQLAETNVEIARRFNVKASDVTSIKQNMNLERLKAGLPELPRSSGRRDEAMRKVTSKKKEKIKTALVAGELSNQEIAEEQGVSAGLISNIKRELNQELGAAGKAGLPRGQRRTSLSKRVSSK
jgi:DNA-binding CsgD family transcriptional regulator